MIKTKRWIAFTLTAATVLGGCGIQEQRSTDRQTENPATDSDRLQASVDEKYVEQSLNIPYENGTENFISLDKDVNGNMHFISRDENFTYHDYEMNSLEGEDIQYEKREIPWLHELAPDYDAWVIDVRLDSDSNPVACVGTAEGRWIIAKDGEKVDIDECPGGFAITSDNHMILPYDRKGSIVDWDGKEIYSFDKGRSPSTISQAADTCHTYIACKNTQEDAVVVYDYADQSKVAEIPYAFNPDEDIIIRLDEQSNIYIADGSGIHKAHMTDSSFTTLVDSVTSTIGMTSTMVMAMEIDSAGNIWCVEEDYNTREAGLYRYAHTEVEGTQETLTFYTMKESDWLKKLVIDFQNVYPQYTVNMVIDNDHAMTTQDKLRNLNAQLLSGSGPDILMLDGLPVDSYIDKGILMDLSDCVENTDVIEGVITASQTGNGTYAIATRMGIPVMLDNQGEAVMLENVDNLLHALQDKKLKLPAIEADALAELLTGIYYDELFTAEGNLDETKLAALIDAMKLMKENGFVGEKDEYAQLFLEKNKARFGLTYLPTFAWTASLVYDLAVNDANIALQECNGISMGMLGIASHLDKNMSVLNNMYFPYGQLGINSGSGSQEAAKQFVSFALSDREQSAYVEDGMPVTYTGLEAVTRVNNPNVEMGMVMPDGSELELSWPTESEIGSFVELCKKVDKSQQMEQVIVEMITTQFQKYLTGEASEDEISGNIKNQIKTYLEEQR